MTRRERPLTDEEIDMLGLMELRRAYVALRLVYEDARFKLERMGYVYEGPNGTPRPIGDVSPNSRLTATVGERLTAMISEYKTK